MKRDDSFSLPHILEVFLINSKKSRDFLSQIFFVDMELEMVNLSSVSSSSISTVNLASQGETAQANNKNRSTLSWNIPEHNKTSYSFRGIKTKRILTDIWGEIQSGELLAVMGPSGMISTIRFELFIEFVMVKFYHYLSSFVIVDLLMIPVY